MSPALDAAGLAIFWTAVAAIGALLCGGVILLTRDRGEERLWADDEPGGQLDLADAPGQEWQPTGRLPGWSRRAVRPARVMADPLAGELARLRAAIAAVPGFQLTPLNVSGPAEVPDLPGAAAVFPQDDCTAGPEAPHPVTTGPPNHRPAAPGVTFLPPVDQAAHLQPIEWADATGSFAAICEDVQS